MTVASSAVAPEPAGTPNAQASDRTSAHSPAAPLTGSGDAAKRTNLEDRIVRFIVSKRDGHMRSEEGACVALLALELDVAPAGIKTALQRLVSSGRVTKTARRGRGGGTSAIVVIDEKGKTDGSVQDLSGGDRVGTNGGRKARAPRREAGAPPRPQAKNGRAHGRRRTKSEAAADRGGRRPRDPSSVGEPLRDVPDGGSAPPAEGSVIAELQRIGTIAGLFDQLSPLGQRYVAETLAERVLGRA